jgi:hypothetical protein
MAAVHRRRRCCAFQGQPDNETPFCDNETTQMTQMKMKQVSESNRNKINMKNEMKKNSGLHETEKLGADLSIGDQCWTEP